MLEIKSNPKRLIERIVKENALFHHNHENVNNNK